MKPYPVVVLQAVAVSVVSLVILAVLGSHASLACAIETSAGATIWLIYAVRRDWLRRRMRLPISGHRRRLNRIMMGCLTGGLLLPAALAWTLTLSGWRGPIKPPLSGGAADILCLAVLTIPASILVSSSVDWNLIRAFRDGVVGPPACERAFVGDESVRWYTRFWVMNRMVCEFLVWMSVAGLIADVGAIVVTDTHSTTGQVAWSVVGSAAVIAWSLANVANLTKALQFILQPSQSGLGEFVRGRNDLGDPVEGLVLDVALSPGVQTIGEPRGMCAGDISEPDHSIPLDHRRGMRRVEPQPHACPGGKCQFWTAECEVGMRAPAAPQSLDSATKRIPLIRLPWRSRRQRQMPAI